MLARLLLFAASRAHTLFLVHSQHDDHLIPSNSDELLDTADTPSRQLGKQDHAVDVIVLKQLHVCAHFCDLCHPQVSPLSDGSEQSCSVYAPASR